MAERIYSWPDNHWRWPIDVSHQHGVRQGDLAFVGGQVDLDGDGTVCHPDDLSAQTHASVANMQAVLQGLGSSLDELVKLEVFYKRDACSDQRALLEQLAAALGCVEPGPAITLVPLSALAYPGLSIEIEGVAMPGTLARTVATLTGCESKLTPFSPALRCGRMVFVSAQDATDDTGSVVSAGDLPAQSELVMRRTKALLERLGLSCDDTVKINRYYVAGGSAAEWETSARVCASFFSEPGPAATGVPLPALHDDGTMLAVEVTAMRGATDEPLAHHHSWPAGHWDWPTHLPYKHGVRCEDLIFVGGQVSLDTNGHVVDAEDLSAQTRTSMHNVAKVLAGFGASMNDVVKVTTFYQGTANADRLHENFAIRSASFTSPGPATTGVPVPYLAYPGMVIEIQVVAMTGKT